MNNDLRTRHVCVLAPPFLSHLMPMLSLAQSFLSLNVKVTVACSPSFQSLIEKRGFQFTEIRINLNANDGSAADTDQENDEKKRLNDFFEATRKGAVETLSLQMRHRGRDMFANPDEVFHRIQELNEHFQIDLWMVDQLSYSVTVSLILLKLSFVTFCPPHPASIPDQDHVYGIPLCWPKKLKPNYQKLQELYATAEKTELDFDVEVNAFIKRIGIDSQVMRRTFSLSSQQGVVYNYPDFLQKENKGTPHRFYMGFSYIEETLSKEWQSLLNRKEKGKIIFLSLGTFLAARDDVLKRVILGVRASQPEALLIVAAGSSYKTLDGLSDDKTVIKDFLPQKAILPHVDLVIHHGGVGTFTETLCNSKPAIVLPFSSDQFNVAADVEKYSLGTVLDPNNFTQKELEEDLSYLLEGYCEESLCNWGEKVRSQGPTSIAKKLLSLI